MKIKRSELLAKYGIELEAGKYDIDVEGNEYVVSTVRDDTEGCILVGNSCDSVNGTIGSSRDAYRALYPKVVKALKAGEKVTLTIE